MKRFVVFFVMYVLTALALTPGETGLGFLKIPIGAKPASLSSTYTALGDDASAFVYNPALTTLCKNEISATHMEYFESMRYDNVLSVLKIYDFYSVGMGIGYFYTPGIPKTIASENLEGFASIGKFYSGDVLLIVNNAVKLSKHAGIGVNAKYISEFIDKQSIYTFSADIGYYVQLQGIKNLKIGVAMRNLGLPTKYRDKKELLPVIATIGLSWMFQEMIQMGLDFEQPLDGFLVAHAGLEGIIMKNYVIRIGYQYNMNQINMNSFSAGAGIVYHNIKFNYAFVPYKYLGVTHRFELGVQF